MKRIKAFVTSLTLAQKLNLFLWILVIAMLYFVTIMVTDKQRQIKSLRNVNQYVSAIQPLQALIYALQQERGLSQGVLAKNQTHYLDSRARSEQLMQQRKQTDLARHVFQQILAQTTSEALTDKQRKRLESGLTLLDGLNNIRSQIDHGLDNNTFDYYTHLISFFIDRIEDVQALEMHGMLDKMATSLVYLVWLEEFAGRERGLIQGLLARDTIQFKQMDQVARYIAGQDFVSHQFTHTAPQHYRQTLRQILTSPDCLTVNQFRQRIKYQTRKQDLLNQIVQLIGFGGLIHDFKNHVIRGGLRYRQHFQQTFAQLQAVLEDYRHLPNISQAETRALNTLERTFKQYDLNITVVSDLKMQGRAIAEIDRQVKINDTPVLLALQQLRIRSLGQDGKTWWSVATRRIDAIHQLTMQFRRDFQQQIEQTISQSQASVRHYILFALVIFCLAAVIGLSLRERLIGQLQRFIAEIRRGQAGENDSALPEDGQDELTELAKTYNAMLDERRRSQQQLLLAQKVFEHAHDGIMVTDAKNCIVDINSAFCRITGYGREEVIGRTPSMLSSGRQDTGFYQHMWQQLHDIGFWQGEIWNRNKHGEVYAELLSISLIRDANGVVSHHLGIFSDITQMLKQREQLRLMAHYDVLTGLPNRVLLLDRFHQAMAHSKRTGRRVAVCYLDLDNFKPVNDHYGHDVGDQLLITVAQRLSEVVREEDTVSRLGGDEFAILLNDIASVDECRETLERIHEAIAQPYGLGDIEHHVSVSIGFTLYPDDNVDIDTLLRHADQAMYQAKQAGRNRFCQYNVTEESEQAVQQLKQNEIAQALENGQFQLYYQPKVDMASGQVEGAEALIRWVHPQRGIIPPMQFLPYIQTETLEIQVGEWVIARALQQLACWQAAGMTLSVSVNISAQHVLSSGFYAYLEKQLARYPEVDSYLLQIEILETHRLNDVQAVQKVIQQCRKGLGISVALDDFGTGYSSLTHLRNLPADTIKIDQSFIQDLLDDPNDYVIVEGVIGLAKAFNRTVIAEGVESTEHGLVLLLMGCHYAQGYAIARPMPVADFDDWLRQYQPNQDWITQAYQPLTQKQRRIRLIQLFSTYWKKRLLRVVQSEPDTTEHWPLMSHTRCYFGLWLERVRQENLFDTHWLDTLDHAHHQIHDIAQAMQQAMNQGQVEQARGQIAQLEQTFDQVQKILQTGLYPFVQVIPKSDL